MIGFLMMMTYNLAEPLPLEELKEKDALSEYYVC